MSMNCAGYFQAAHLVQLYQSLLSVQ